MPKLDANRLGSSIPAKDGSSCRTCQLRDICKDPRKAQTFCCTYFQGKADKDDRASADFLSWMRTLTRSESLLTDSYGIDDREAKLAPNFYRWCTHADFLAAKPTPFPWQLEIGMRIFGDMCPWCSDPDWYQEIPFDCDPLEIPEFVQLRRNGICPACRRSVLDGIAAGVEHDVSNFVGVVGQRSGKCIAGGTLVPTTRGLLPIESIVVGDYVIVNGKEHLVTTTHITRAKKTSRLLSVMGYSLEATADHQIQTVVGWTALKDAKTVLVRADSPPRLTEKDWQTRWPLLPNPRQEQWTIRSRKEVQALADMPAPWASFILKSHFVEDVSGLNLVLKVQRGDAALLQLALLGFGVFCKRPKSGPDILLVEQPWATTYLEQIGVSSPQVAQHLKQASGMDEGLVNKIGCAALLTLFVAQGYAELAKDPASNPGMFYQAQIVHASLLHGDLTRQAARKAAELVSALPTKDVFLRTMLRDAFLGAADATYVWDKVVSIKHNKRVTVYDIQVPGVHRFIAGGLEVHNSTGVGNLISYQQHRLLKLKNPSDFYGIKANTILHTNVIGISFNRVKTTVWDPLMATIQDAPWFDLYHEILLDAGKKRGEDDLVKVMDTYIFYRPAALRISPSSSSTRSLRGPTRIGFVIDELGHFSSDNQKINIAGQEVWNVCLNSLQTVRPQINRLRREGVVMIPPALAMAISSPRDVADPIMVLRKALAPKNNSYVMLRPTWEANPFQTFDMLDAEITDKIALQRDFGCQPPFSENAFVSSPDLLFDVINDSIRPAFRQKTVPVNAGSSAKRAITVRIQKKWSDPDTPRIMAIDAGRKLNAFSAAIGHLDQDGNVAYDAFLEIRPRPGMHVSFTAAYHNVLSPIIADYNVRAIASDRWQNYMLIDSAQEDHKLVAVGCQLRYTDFLAWREDLTHKRICIPRPEIPRSDIIDINRMEEDYFDDRPTAQFIRQSIRVIDVPGKTVGKPATGNDDVFRAGVVLHASTRIPEVAAVLRQSHVRKKGVNGVVAVSIGSYGYAPQVPIAIGTMSGLDLSKFKSVVAPPPPPQVRDIARKDYKSLDGRHTIREITKKSSRSQR